jgi:hypothetical protein
MPGEIDRSGRKETTSVDIDTESKYLENRLRRADASCEVVPTDNILAAELEDTTTSGFNSKRT